MPMRAQVLAPPVSRSTDVTLASDLADYELAICDTFQNCAGIWRELERDVHIPVFQTYAWMECWYNAIGKARGVTPAIVTVRDRTSGRPVLLLPFGTDTVLGLKTLVWMAQAEADYHAPLTTPHFSARCTPHLMRQIIAKVVQEISGLHAINLIKTATKFEGTANPVALLPHDLHPSAAHAIALSHKDFDALYASRRGKSTRRKDKQRLRRMSNIGEVDFVVARHTAEQHSMLDKILAQKACWLAARGITDPFAGEDVKQFLHGLIDSKEAEKDLHISALTLDGDVVAGNFGYVHAGRFYAVIGSFVDGEIARHSPGILHLHEMLKWCFANNCHTYDLTVGDEGYKSDWCDEQTSLVDIRLSLSVAGYLANAPQRLKDTIKRHIKATPWMFELASHIRRLTNRQATP